MNQNKYSNVSYRGFHRERLTLNQAMEILGIRWTNDPHVFFNPKCKPNYRIKRETQHDGTYFFTLELLKRALINLFDKRFVHASRYSCYIIKICPYPIASATEHPYLTRT